MTTDETGSHTVLNEGIRQARIDQSQSAQSRSAQSPAAAGSPRLSRRAMLFGRAAGPTPIRPPGALPEADFSNACNGCLECVKRCPQLILVKSKGGLPAVDFTDGYCNFCFICIDACPTSALRRDQGGAVWNVAVHLATADCLPERGIDCRVCGDFCDSRAITFRPRGGGQLAVQLDRSRCTGCGACVAPCPVAAIRIEPISGQHGVERTCG